MQNKGLKKIRNINCTRTYQSDHLLIIPAAYILGLFYCMSKKTTTSLGKKSHKPQSVKSIKTLIFLLELDKSETFILFKHYNNTYNKQTLKKCSCWVNNYSFDFMTFFPHNP